MPEPLPAPELLGVPEPSALESEPALEEEEEESLSESPDPPEPPLPPFGPFSSAEPRTA